MSEEYDDTFLLIKFHKDISTEAYESLVNSFKNRPVNSDIFVREGHMIKSIEVVRRKKALDRQANISTNIQQSKST